MVGESTKLQWSVGNVDHVSIDQGIGDVGKAGNRRVFLSYTQTFTLTATGPGGTATLCNRPNFLRNLP